MGIVRGINCPSSLPTTSCWPNRHFNFETHRQVSGPKPGEAADEWVVLTSDCEIICGHGWWNDALCSPTAGQLVTVIFFCWNNF